MHQYLFDFICLFHLDAHTDGVDTGFDEDLFVFITGDVHRLEEEFCAGVAHFDFRPVVSFHLLRREVR